MPDTDTTDEPPEVLEFRRQHAAINGAARGPQPPRPAPRLPDADELEDTVSLRAVIREVRAMEAEEVYEAARWKAAQRTTWPLSVTGTIVLVVLILAGLVAWLGWLYLTRVGVA